jgi:hypothetical protein
MPRIDRPSARPRVTTDRSTPPARTRESAPAAAPPALRSGYVKPEAAVPSWTALVSTSAQPFNETRDLPGGVTYGPKGFAFDNRDTVDPAGLTRGVINTLYKAALKLTAFDENPFQKLPARARKDMLQHLLPFAIKDSKYRGRTSSLSLKSRTASYALLITLAESMVTQGERKTRAKIFDFLLDAASNEKHPGVRGQLISGLQEIDKKVLSGTQARLRKKLAEQLTPSKPPYDEWFKPGEPAKVNVVQYIQDEFWRKEIAHLRKEGWKVTVDDSGLIANATKTMKDPKAGETEFSMTLYQRDTEIFEAMSDPNVHVVIYSGHAGVGGNAKIALETAAESEGPKKLLSVLACRTKQNLPAISRRYPLAHCLVSDNGTYGHDDRLLMSSMFEGIAARKDYTEIEKAHEKKGPWETNNYFLPGEIAQLAYRDLDGDGVAARTGTRRDLVYNVDLRSGRDNSVSFRPRRKDVDVDALPGGKVLDAVGWMNSVYFYYAEAFGNADEWQRADQLRADGWFKSDDPNDIVRIQKVVPDDGGYPEWRVKVNAAYSNQDPDALGMMVTYALGLKMFEETRPDESEYQQRMRAMAMTCSYVVNIVRYSDVGDTLMQGFAKRFGFPPGLSFDLAWTAVNSDGDNEASPKIIKKLEKGMQYPFLEVNEARTSHKFRKYIQEGLDELRRLGTPMAERTFELICTGGIKIDELSDLSKEDFEHLRKEFARDGVHFEAGDFYDLHDGRTKVARAIKQSIDGYMWDNRIYVAPGLSPKQLAVTLAHEVNHVLNESEENYRSKKAILLEEYRAHLVEKMTLGVPITPELCKEIKEYVIDAYGLQPLTADDVPDDPPGVFEEE